MKISTPFLFLILLAALPLTVAAAEPEVIYWNSDAGKVLRAKINNRGQTTVFPSPQIQLSKAS
jgi:hypothetical protein